MENITWQKPAVAPSFAMPICGSSARARTLGDAVRVTGLTAFYRVGESDAWSPPIS